MTRNLQDGCLQNELYINDPGNHGKYQDGITRVNEEGEKWMLPAFFGRFFFLCSVHIVTLMEAGGASIKLFEQVGNQYRQADDHANECFPILKHDFSSPKN